DVLLALGAQPVGEEREVHPLLAPSLARALDGIQLILEDRLRIVEEPPDEGALAVVDASRGAEPQAVHLQIRRGRGRSGKRRAHQKYPCRLRSSIAASDRCSSARVAPRSLIRVVAISSMMSLPVLAADSTAPVHV